ncbi:hypothetical protein MRBLMI12_000446 [Microbacterium sp. LMI12-1-1.1]|uniref:hypothetical protein n=1 Tax=Microbacterium sp. LMI12-1-1.1 TaxID=3135225 RepID=UPI00342EF653
MTDAPAPRPYVVFVEATVAVEMLVYATDLESASDIAEHNAPALATRLSEQTGLTIDSPFVRLDIGARQALYSEVIEQPAAEPAGYQALVPYFPTFIRDPDDWPEAIAAPDFPPTDDKENA